MATHQVAKLTRQQFAQLLSDLVASPDGIGEDLINHDEFVLSLAQVVADHCGGKPELIIAGNDIEIHVGADAALPSVSQNVWTQAVERYRLSDGGLAP